MCWFPGPRQRVPTPRRHAHTCAFTHFPCVSGAPTLPSSPSFAHTHPRSNLSGSKTTRRDFFPIAEGRAMSVPHAIATSAVLVPRAAFSNRGSGAVKKGRVTARVAPGVVRRNGNVNALPARGPKSSLFGNNDAPKRQMTKTAASQRGPDGYSVDGMGCVDVDEQLHEHEGHLKYRWEKFVERKNAITDAEGSLLKFAKGYEKFGFTKTSAGEIVYREWAPAAQSACLIGDFNEWNPEATGMEKDEFGVWSVTLPAGSIKHKTRVKIRMQKGAGLSHLPRSTSAITALYGVQSGSTPHY
jgi:hypothetical protein